MGSLQIWNRLRGNLANPGLAAFNILSQDCIDCRLIAFAGFAKESNDIGIETQGDLLLGPRPKYCIREEIRTESGNIGIVDILISERINPFPIRFGLRFRILSVLHDLPFSAR